MTQSQKIFCIGFNKTGTQSMKQAFIDLGFTNGPGGEVFALDALSGKYDDFIEYTRQFDTFQHTPYSNPEIYKILDKHFPGSKFILTVRDSPEAYWRSFRDYTLRIFGKSPTVADAKKFKYHGVGWYYKVSLFTSLKDRPHNDNTLLLDESILKKQYEYHYIDVVEYFKDRPDDLLIINLKDPQSYRKFCAFIDKKPVYDKFPHKMKGAVH